jgi:hypothetical protein
VKGYASGSFGDYIDGVVIDGVDIDTHVSGLSPLWDTELVSESREIDGTVRLGFAQTQVQRKSRTPPAKTLSLGMRLVGWTRQILSIPGPTLLNFGLLISGALKKRVVQSGTLGFGFRLTASVTNAVVRRVIGLGFAIDGLVSRTPVLDGTLGVGFRLAGRVWNRAIRGVLGLGFRISGVILETLRFRKVLGLGFSLSGWVGARECGIPWATLFIDNTSITAASLFGDDYAGGRPGCGE